MLRAPSNLALNPARERAATASLGNLGQGLIILRVRVVRPFTFAGCTVEQRLQTIGDPRDVEAYSLCI